MGKDFLSSFVRYNLPATIPFPRSFFSWNETAEGKSAYFQIRIPDICLPAQTRCLYSCAYLLPKDRSHTFLRREMTYDSIVPDPVPGKSLDNLHHRFHIRCIPLPDWKNLCTSRFHCFRTKEGWTDDVSDVLSDNAPPSGTAPEMHIPQDTWNNRGKNPATAKPQAGRTCHKKHPEACPRLPRL